MVAKPMAVGNGVHNPTLIHAMKPDLWHKDTRFKRFGENDDVGIGQGGHGTVFQGFDELRQEMVYIKRQSKNGEAAARETASYMMLEYFPHPNILRMYGMWTGNYVGNSYLYIAM